MGSHNFGALSTAVLDASAARSWADAVTEWQVVAVEEEPRATGVCICGKTNLRYLYTIFNRVTEVTLFPIGSSCVNLFELEELSHSVTVLRQLFELRAAFVAGRRVDLTSEYFSRALLAELWEIGAFPPNQYNGHDGHNDYTFLLNLFNRRHDFTTREDRKVWVLINRAIRPCVLADPRLADSD